MKYILIAGALLIVAAFAIEGCYDNPPNSEKLITTMNYDVHAVDIKGHEYIIYDGVRKGGIIHSESCPCKNGGAK